MQWYNPKTRAQEEIPASISEAQAIEMLSGHPKSDRLIEEYRRLRYIAYTPSSDYAHFFPPL